MTVKSKEWWSLKENGEKKNSYTNNQKDPSEICWTYNKEGKLGKLNTDRGYRGKER